jgi:ribonuclease P protein component
MDRESNQPLRTYPQIVVNPKRILSIEKFLIKQYCAQPFRRRNNQTGWQDHEKNFSAERTETQTYPRLSRTHEHPWRPCRYPCSPRQGPGSPERLISVARFGLPGSRRLRKRVQFDRVFDQKCSSSDRLFAVYASTANGDGPRLGLVVSRRVSTKAVVRNRIKRQVRELFRHTVPELNDLDVVVVARTAAAAADSLNIRSSLERHWKRIIKQCGNS